MAGFFLLVMLAMLFGVAVAVTLAVSRLQLLGGNRNEAYRKIAARFNGACVGGHWFRSPHVTFRYGGTYVLLHTQRQSGAGDHTILETGWPDAKLTCEVRCRRSPWPSGLNHLRPCPLGIENFDHDFEVRGNSEDATRGFLGEGVRWQIHRLWHGRSLGDLVVAIHAGTLQIRKQGRIARHEDLEQFVILALGLLDQALLARTTGIEFMQSDLAQLVEDAQCQICGEEIDQELVFCRRCKTPHHMDCWHYYGACSTYGCQEKQYLVPSTAKLVHNRALESAPEPEQQKPG